MCLSHYSAIQGYLMQVWMCPEDLMCTDIPQLGLLEKPTDCAQWLKDAFFWLDLKEGVRVLLSPQDSAATQMSSMSKAPSLLNPGPAT